MKNIELAAYLLFVSVTAYICYASGALQSAWPAFIAIVSLILAAVWYVRSMISTCISYVSIVLVILTEPLYIWASRIFK